MTDYTRVTITGEGRKADLVLPDDEPVAALLPDVLELLDEESTGVARPVVLVTTVGEQLDASLTLAEQDVRHGTMLRVVRVDAAPPPPDVADVTEVVGDVTANRADVWRREWGVAAAGVLAVLLGVAAVAAGRDLDAALLALTPAVLVVAAAALARRARTGPAVVVTGGAVGTALAPAVGIAAQYLEPGVGGVLLVWFALACLVVGAVLAAGFALRATGLGSLTGTALVALWLAARALGLPPEPSASTAAVLGVLVLGVLPGVAMALSGLSGLDDRVVEGERVGRDRTRRAVDATHRTLTSAALCTAVVSGGLAWYLTGAADTWSRLVAVAVGVVLLLRTRVLPLAPQRLALIAAGSAPLLALLVSWSGTDPVVGSAACVGAVLVLALVAGLRPRDHVAARLRRLAGVVELLAVLSLVPLVLASLGVFADLAETF